ncbi:hypothetical protein AX16_007687 [Volvariella volvacea WC 439]|nr:hypothetical protein AX16_007687 [Volvariella volvacea WC 439]
MSHREQQFWGNIFQLDNPLLPAAYRHSAESIDGAPSPAITTYIFTVPEDVLVEIFHLTRPEYNDPSQFYSYFSSLLSLSHVCRTWRNTISLNMPTAWSKILIRLPKSTGIVRLAELSLIRTGDTCPLNLSITPGFQYSPPLSSQEVELVIEVFNLFISYADRWHTIQIKFRYMFPPGRILSLPIPRNLVFVRGIMLWEWEQAAQDQIWEAINSSLRLRRVHWENVIPRSTPWSQLENVRIAVDYIQPLKDVLPRFTNLTSLSMRCGDFTGFHPQDFTTELITIPALRVLDLDGFHINPVLDRIVAPRLQELDIYNNYAREAHPDLFPSIHTFLTQSNCHLRTLSIRDPGTDYNSLLIFLRQSLTTNTLSSLEDCHLYMGPCIADEVIRLLTIPILDEHIHGLSSLSHMICLPFGIYRGPLGHPTLPVFLELCSNPDLTMGHYKRLQ